MRKLALFLSFVMLMIMLVACNQGSSVEPIPVVTEAAGSDEATPTVVATAVIVPEVEATEATITAEPTVTATTETTGVDTNQELADADWEPQIVFSNPTSGEQVVLDGAITIRFDQAMDQASVEEAFSIVGDVPAGSITGDFMWTRPDELTFTPAGQLDQQQDYVVEIDDSARSVNGKALREPLSLRFQTTGSLAVSQVIPADKTQNVSVDASITILFNRPVVPLVSTGQQANLVQPVTFSPDIVGAGEWINTSIYRFTPSDPLLAATTYDVNVAAGLQDVTGDTLADNVATSFRTVSPQVVLVGEGDRTEIAPDQTISVTFNMPMSQPETQAAIEWQPPVEVTYNWSADGRTVGITPVSPMELQTSYTLFVSEFSMAAVGRAEMGSPHLTQFRTLPFPRVFNTYPNNGESLEGDYVPYQGGVTINFNTDMKPNTVYDSFIIDPAPEGLTYTGAGNQFSANFKLQYETAYRVVVPSSVQDVYGNTMSEDYVLEFTTQTAPPVGAFNLPDSFAQLSRSFSSNVNFLYRNLPNVGIRLERYETLPLDQLATGPDYYSDSGNPAGELVREWLFEYEADTAGASELALADGGALPNGVYRLVANSPAFDEQMSYWQNQDVLLVVGETNLTVKETPERVHVWATDLDSGQPVAGRELTFFYRRDNGGTPTEFATATTDENGLATVAKDYPISSFSRYDYRETILVQSGQPDEFGFGLGSPRWNTSVSPWAFNIRAQTAPELPQTMALFTDRPIYRPGDTVYIRGWVRDNTFGRYTIPTPDAISLTLNSPNFDSSPAPFTFELDQNGGFYGEWVIPEDADLGGWYLSADSDLFSGQLEREIVVAEFRKPEYLVELTPNPAEAVRGDEVEMMVSAEFFFGGAASNLPVEYSIYSNPYSIPNSGSRYYNFTNHQYNPFPFFYGIAFGFGTHIGNGQGETDADGNFVIQIPSELIAEQNEGGLRLTVEATIVDTTGLAVSGNADLVLHPAEVYVGSTPQQYVSTVQSGVTVDVVTVDWAGDAVGGQPVEVTFVQRDWKAISHPWDPNRVSWDAVDTELEQVSLTTDANGQGSASFAPDAGGVYVAISTVTDAGGRTHTSNTTFYVWGDETTWRFDTEDRKMELTASVDELKVGDSAEILVQAPFAGMTAWLTIERGELIEQRLITLDSTSEILTFEMLPEYAPNVFISVAAVKGTDDSERPVADIRYGIVELQVDPERLLLDVEITPDQETYSPRDEVTYQIKTTDYLGNGVSAELSLALVDLAVLTLKEDPAQPLAETFYAPQPLRSLLGAGLFVSGEGLDIEIPSQPLGGGGGGGGGDAAVDTVALDREAEVDENGEVRDDFRDLAHWEAIVTTDANGEATVTVKLPDNLTTWRLNAKAVSEQTLVGEASRDILATRQLLIRPVTPRFLTFGDRVQMTAVVNNQSANDIDATASLEATGVSLDGEAEQSISVPAGGSALVRWPVTVQDVSSVDLIFRVKGGGLFDASRPTVGEIPVYRFNAEDIVATAGMLGDENRRVEAVLLPPLVDSSLGDLSINLSPSLAAAMIDALEASNQSETDDQCSYSLAYRLLPNASSAETIRALSLDKPNLLTTLDAQIEREIAGLANLQRTDGGWDYCDKRNSSPWMTAFALHALATAQQIGYETGTLEDAIRYLLEAANTIDVTDTESATTQAYYLYVVSLVGENVSGEVDKLLDEGRNLLPPHAAAMVVMALDNSGADVPANLLSDIATGAVVNATGAHWEGGNALSFNSDVRVTAVVVNALVQVEPDHALLPNAVRWLMGARSGRYWRSARDTSWTIAALSAWMQASDELEADYNYVLRVNEGISADGRFATANIDTQSQVQIPLSELSETDVNFLDFQKEGDGNLYYTAYLDAFISADSVDAVDRGFSVERHYYDATCEENCEPITSIASGQEVRVELTIRVENNRRFVRIEDPLPAGADAVDPNLDTSSRESDVEFGYQRGYWGYWYFNRIKFRDEKVVFVSDYLPAGTYQYSYHLQPIVPGEYQIMPTIAKEVFQIEVFGRSQGQILTIIDQ